MSDDRVRQIAPAPAPQASGHRDRHAAMLRDRENRRKEAADQQARQALLRQLGELPAEEPEPDPRYEAWAQAGATVALSLGAEVSVQAMIDGAPWFARAGAVVGCLALFAGLVGAAWNTHVARRGFWRPVAWSWLGVWSICLFGGLGTTGLSEAISLGAGTMLLVSVFAAAVAFAAAMAAAHHVDAVAARHASQQSRRQRRESITQQLALLDGASDVVR